MLDGHHGNAAHAGSGWRLLYRIPWLAVHFLVALPLAVVAQSRLLRDRIWGEYTVEDIAGGWWCRGLLRIFGMRLRVVGELQHDAVLVVANHISWLDIVALLSLRMLRFVAKAEIRAWPVVGWLVSRARTVYVQRGNSDSAQQVLNTMTAQLNAGQTVAIFPEGGIPMEPGVARFRSRLLDAAIDAGVDVEPICLRYCFAGRVDKAVSFLPDEHFMANFLRLLSGPPMVLEVRILSRMRSVGQDRRDLARQAEHSVRAAYESIITDAGGDLAKERVGDER